MKKNKKRIHRGIFVLSLGFMMFGVGCGKQNKDEKTSTLVNITEEITTEAATFAVCELPRTIRIEDIDCTLKQNALDASADIYKMDDSAWNTDKARIIDAKQYNDNEIIILYSSNDLYRIHLLTSEVVAKGTLQDSMEDTWSDYKINVGSDGRILVNNISNGHIQVFDEALTLKKEFHVPESEIVRFCCSEDAEDIYYTCHNMPMLYHCSVSTEKLDSVEIKLDVVKDGYGYINIDSLADDGKQAAISIYNSDGEVHAMVDLSTGEVVKQFENELTIIANNESEYVGYCWFDASNEFVSGLVGEEPSNLFYLDAEEMFNVQADMQSEKLFTYISWPNTEEDASEHTLRIYGIDGVKQKEKVFRMKGAWEYLTFTDYMDAMKTAIFVSDSEDNSIYIWDLLGSDADTTESCLYSMESFFGNDTEANADIQGRIEIIEQKYGIDISFGDDVNQLDVWDYDIDPLYNAIACRRAIEKIDKELSLYPDGMLAQMQNGYEKPLSIYLAEQLTGVSDCDTIEMADGIANSDMEHVYFVIDCSEVGHFERTIHHELFHTIENYMATNGWYFDDEQWNSYNPAGFEYDYNYGTNSDNFDDSYVASTYDNESEDISFIDIYSKSFPLEDRARIMEFAMNEERYANGYFEYDNICNKLAYESEMIRNAFDTTGWPEKTVWEEVIY